MLLEYHRSVVPVTAEHIGLARRARRDFDLVEDRPRRVSLERCALVSATVVPSATGGLVLDLPAMPRLLRVLMSVDVARLGRRRLARGHGRCDRGSPPCVLPGLLELAESALARELCHRGLLLTA
jgi:hypothetical protein